MSRKFSIGILGGTFDPIHFGHLKLAEHAKKELDLDKIIFIPAHIPPHKKAKTVSDDIHRLNMVERALSAYDDFLCSDFEIKLGGDSYTARTLSILSEEYDNPVFILGADSYMALETWYHPEIIFEKAAIACAVRDDVDKTLLMKKSEYYSQKYNAKSFFLNMPKFDISSTLIRELIKSGRSISEYVPETVSSYIEENKLYK